MSTRLEKCSKSLPPVEFQLYTISGEDSGIDSDTSPVSSTKLSSSIEELEDEHVVVNPSSFLLGENAAESERLDGITKALDWLREELTKMKETDKQLTRTFITVRSKIAEQKCMIDSDEYPSYFDDTESLKPVERRRSDNWNVIAKDGAFPGDSTNFQNNKRATWVI